MKRRFKNSCKGFTLIEVIVAMVILGIASLLLVGMYASVCARIRSNNDFNDRMSEQQKYVETKAAGTNASLFDVHYDSSIPNGSTKYGATTPSGNYSFTIKCVTDNANTSFVNKEFTARCAVYTLKNIDDGVVVATDDDDVQVDYKYFVGDNS